MKIQNRLVAHVVSLSLALAPLLSQAKTTNSGGIDQDFEITTLNDSIAKDVDLMNKKSKQLALVSRILTYAEQKYSSSETSGYFSTAALFGYGLGSVLMTGIIMAGNEKLDDLQMKALAQYKEKVEEIGTKVLQITGATSQLRTNGGGDAAYDYIHVSVSKNPNASKELAALSKEYSKPEMKAAAQFIAKAKYGRWFVVKAGLKEYPETALAKATRRAGLRGGAAGLLIRAGIVTTFASIYWAMGKLFFGEIKPSPSEGLEDDQLPLYNAAVGQIDSIAKSKTTDELNKKIEAYSQKSIELSGEITLIQKDISSLQSRLANLQANTVLK